jgi:hypothetical protein
MLMDKRITWQLYYMVAGDEKRQGRWKTRQTWAEELAWIAILWLASLGVFLHEVDCAPLIADDAEL